MTGTAPSNSERNGYLETIGRKSGQPRETEIWYAVTPGAIVILSGYHDNKDWFKNFQAQPRVRFRIGSDWHTGTMRVVDRSEPIDMEARWLLVEKYYGVTERTDELPNEWSQTGTVVAIDLD
ncbi:MAG: nitroreductase family deazaflavin-dependent oxidoreductase [Thermomicrobiales bacterium]|nr:nitroreductase family deazaflavin-dependent oxidoreductase [Thermomicrobiales bacterium]